MSVFSAVFMTNFYYLLDIYTVYAHTTDSTAEAP